MTMNVTIRLLGPNDQSVLDRVADDVVNNPINPAWAAELLAAPRHHLAVATIEDQVIGFASGVHYLHPDKPPELWINEVGVASAHQGNGIGKRLLTALFERGCEVGCATA